MYFISHSFHLGWFMERIHSISLSLSSLLVFFLSQTKAFEEINKLTVRSEHEEEGEQFVTRGAWKFIFDRGRGNIYRASRCDKPIKIGVMRVLCFSAQNSITFFCHPFHPTLAWMFIFFFRPKALSKLCLVFLSPTRQGQLVVLMDTTSSWHLALNLCCGCTTAHNADQRQFFLGSDNLKKRHQKGVP